MRRRHLLAMPALLVAPVARGQDGYPSRPLRMVVPFPPGGVTDLMARLAARELERALGQPVVADNRPGAAGNLAVDLVAKAPPDGHTIGIGTPSNLAINPHLYAKLPYDVARDLAPLSLFAINPNVILVHPDVPANSVTELIGWLRNRPGQAYASPGIGTTQHLTVELLARAARLELSHVPYRGASAAILDVTAGRVPLMVDVVNNALTFAREGKVRAIAVTTPERLSQAPDVPTVAETLPGFEATSWLGFIAPAGVPAPILDRLSSALAAAAREPEVARRVTEGGAIPRGTTRADFAAFIRAETELWGPAVRASGARVE